MCKDPWTIEQDGNTPLDHDESEGLIPAHISTRAELNQWEAANIAEAFRWANTRPPDVLDPKQLRELHRRMFAKTWTWAGKCRTSEKSISRFAWPEVPRLVGDLLANTRTQYEWNHASGGALDELATRFHHELVVIHPWPNGNGRHSRLATDLLLLRWGRPVFTWGRHAFLDDPSALRSNYLAALRAADAGDFGALIRFVRS